MRTPNHNAKQTTAAPAPMLSKERMRALLVGLGIGVVLVAAGEYAFVSAESAKATNLQTMVDAKRRENVSLEALIGTPEAYDEFKKQCENEQVEFEQALGAVPSEQELAAALTDLEAVMKSTGVNLVSFTPGKAIANANLAQPAPPVASRDAAAAKDAKKDPKGPDAKDEAPAPVTIQARPIDVTVLANFRSYQALLNALAGHSRVLTTEGFTMSSDSTRPPYSMKSKIALKVYFKQVPAEAAAPAPGK